MDSLMTYHKETTYVPHKSRGRILHAETHAPIQ